MLAEVTGLDPAARRVTARRPLGEPAEFGYDWLTLAAGVVRHVGSWHVFQAVAAGRNSGSEPTGRVSDNRSIYNRQITTRGPAPVAIRQVLRRFLLQRRRQQRRRDRDCWATWVCLPPLAGRAVRSDDGPGAGSAERVPLTRLLASANSLGALALRLLSGWWELTRDEPVAAGELTGCGVVSGRYLVS
jgi:hypothetical protein